MNIKCIYALFFLLYILLARAENPIKNEITTTTNKIEPDPDLQENEKEIDTANDIYPEQVQNKNENENEKKVETTNRIVPVQDINKEIDDTQPSTTNNTINTANENMGITNTADNRKSNGNEDPIDTIVNTNTTLDSCGNTSYQFGVFSFHRPISKSILVQYTNFTIIWYYNNLINDNYIYPSEYVTLSLFAEEDANPNDWAKAFKSPVWERMIPMSEVQAGPVLKNNVPSYQWVWSIFLDEEGQMSSEGLQKILRINERYKLRISGDGKDLQRNPNLQCYQEGDILPGLTRAFYMVDNQRLPSYKPFAIPDGAWALSPFHPLTWLLSISTTLTLFYLLM